MIEAGGQDTVVDDRPLDRLLREWVVAGLITPHQADRITTWTAQQEPLAPTSTDHGRSESLATEALTYVGGVLVLVAGAVLTGSYWEELPLPARVGLLGAAWALLLGTGARIGGAHPGVPSRARAVLWALSTAAVAGLIAVLAHDGFDQAGSDLATAVSAGTAGQAAVLWWVQRSTLQHLVLLAAVLATAAATTMQLSAGGAPVGGVLWLTAVLWAALAWTGYVQPRRPGYLAAAAAAVCAALVVAVEAGWGHALAVGTAVAVVVLAVLLRDLVLLAIGTVATLVTVPMAVTVLWPSDLAPPLALLAAGATALTAAVTGWRRHG
jgi:hypothetical protein